MISRDLRIKVVWKQNQTYELIAEHSYFHLVTFYLSWLSRDSCSISVYQTPQNRKFVLPTAKELVVSWPLHAEGRQQERVRVKNFILTVTYKTTEHSKNPWSIYTGDAGNTINHKEQLHNYKYYSK